LKVLQSTLENVAEKNIKIIKNVLYNRVYNVYNNA